MELRVRSKDAAHLQNKFAPRFVRRSRKVWIPTPWLSFWSPCSVRLRSCWTVPQPRPSQRRPPPLLLRLPPHRRRLRVLNLSQFGEFPDGYRDPSRFTRSQASSTDQTFARLFYLSRAVA